MDFFLLLYIALWMSNKPLLLCLKLIITSTQIRKSEAGIFLRYCKTAVSDLDSKNLLVLINIPSSPLQHNFHYSTATEYYVPLLPSTSRKKNFNISNSVTNTGEKQTGDSKLHQPENVCSLCSNRYYGEISTLRTHILQYCNYETCSTYQN